MVKAEGRRTSKSGSMYGELVIHENASGVSQHTPMAIRTTWHPCMLEQHSRELLLS